MIVLLTRLPDDRHEPAKKCDCNEQRRVRHANRQEKDRSQRGIDERNGDLRAHDRRKASVKIAEPSRDLIAANGVKIILHPMRASVGIKPGFEKEARGSDDSKDAENQVRGRGFGNVCNVAQIIRFLPKRADHHLPQTFKISKRQLDLPLLSPCAGRRNRGIRHIRQRQNGRASKINSGGGNPGYSDR